jgi:hypothetical protein
MSLDAWILALHVLSAFALVGALTIFSIALMALRSVDTPGRVLALSTPMLVAQRAVLVGVAGTIVFGVWLALTLPGTSLLDLWVILALVGWVAATGLGMRSGGLLTPGFTRAEELAAEGADGPDAGLAATFRSSTAHALHWASVAITLLILVDMIWKPGA